MAILYLLAVWLHILAMALWIGAMCFADPQSNRFLSRLFERRLHGIGWYAQAVLWGTGLFMLGYRGISPGDLVSSEFVATSWGRGMWVKLGLVLMLAALQLSVGNRPSKLSYAYIIVAVAVVGVSVMLVRPIVVF